MWRGKMKSEETTQTISLLYICRLNSEINDLSFTEKSKWISRSERAADRALGISKRVATDASVKCRARPVGTCCQFAVSPVLKMKTVAAQLSRWYLRVDHISNQGHRHKS